MGFVKFSNQKIRCVSEIFVKSLQLTENQYCTIVTKDEQIDTKQKCHRIATIDLSKKTLFDFVCWPIFRNFDKDSLTLYKSKTT